MIATKEQERKALAKIKKIVEELGEDSYIGTAFDGCFELAEQNIENDWAMSLKGQNEQLNKDLKNKCDQVDHALDVIDDLQEQINNLKNEIDSLKTKNKEMNINRFNFDDLYDVIHLAKDKAEEERAIADNAAVTIVANAEDPECEAFKDAVLEHRRHKGEADYWQAIADRGEDVYDRMKAE